MKRKDLIVLGILAGVLVGGISLMFIQRREPPGYQEEHITPSEAGYHGRDAARGDGPLTAVYWISVDGFHPGYLDRADTPFFDSILAGGAFSLEHEVVFPSVTFPSHVSQATGVRPRSHGIPMNRFYDLQTRRHHSFPSDSRLLQAEPIWTTAARQGIRVASLDWVLSHGQAGEHRTEFFDSEYRRGLANEERLERLLEIWRDDGASPEPLRLMMGYAVGPDTPGHRYGPGSDEVIAAVEEIDDILGRHYEEIIALWDERMEPEDELYFIVTSDHGMTEVRTLVHPGYLTGLKDRREEIILISGGPIAHIYFDRKLPLRDRERIHDATLRRLASYSYVRAFSREELPLEWNYGHPSRTGDIVIVLDPGYVFSEKPDGITMSAEDGGGPFGMHGYDPKDDPNMKTIALFHRHPEPLGGVDLGPVHSLQLHPTVAGILGIDPAEGAAGDPIDLEPAQDR